MPKKYDRCLKDVRKKIKQGKIKKTYKRKGKKYKTSEYKICANLK